MYGRRRAEMVLWATISAALGVTPLACGHAPAHRSLVGRYVGSSAGAAASAQHFILDFTSDGVARFSPDTTPYPYAIRGDTVWLAGVGTSGASAALIWHGDSLALLGPNGHTIAALYRSQ